MKWILPAGCLVVVSLGLAAQVYGDAGLGPFFKTHPGPERVQRIGPDNAVPLKVEIRDDIHEPRLIISRQMLTRAKAVAAANFSSQPALAERSSPFRPMRCAGLFLGLALGGFCLVRGRKAWAVCAVLLALAFPVVGLRANPVMPGAPPWKPPVPVAQMIALPPFDVIIEDDTDSLWFRLQLPRSKQTELNQWLANQGPGPVPR
jgi:hypothetical protein